MKFSVFTVIMGEYSVEDAAAELASLGYDGVEWRIHPDFHIAPDQLEACATRLKDLSADNGLHIPSLGTYVKVHEIEQLELSCRAAAMLACPNIRVALRRTYDGQRCFTQLFDEARADLMQASAVLEKYQVRGLFEIHHGTIAESASGIRRLLENFPPELFGAIFDPGNMILAGHESWRMGVDILGSYLAHVHVKNVTWHREGSQWVWAYDTLEDGMVSWREVIAALADSGYSGFVSVEDLYGVTLETTGFVDERLPSAAAGQVSIKQKLADDLAFLESCIGETRPSRGLSRKAKSEYRTPNKES